MEWLIPNDWSSILIPDTPILEIIVRGSIMYLFLFMLLRFILKRQAGALSMTDLLVIVLIADASQNAIADDYTSLSDGMVLVSVLVFWNYALEWLGYHFPRFEKILHPAPLTLIKNGRFNRKNMKQELITEDELFSRLRERGIENMKNVKLAFLEGDGKISIIEKA